MPPPNLEPLKIPDIMKNYAYILTASHWAQPIMKVCATYAQAEALAQELANDPRENYTRINIEAITTI